MAKTDAVGMATQPGIGSELGSVDPIQDAMAYLQMCNSADGNNRLEALDDMQFLRGDHWPDTIEQARAMEKRPCLTINKLPTFLHQVTNNQRMNVPSIKISPVEDGDEKVAEIYQGAIRHIEYASNADVAYDTAVNSAAACGFGYFRLITDYCDPKSFDQEIRFRRIRNAFTVYFDPLSQEPDGSDQRRCLISERLTHAEFKKQYPKAQLPSSGLDTGSGDPTRKDWYGADFVRVAEFYRIEETDDTLYQLPDGTLALGSELPAETPTEGLKSRPTTKQVVMWRKITAVEVLEETEIKCKWIPVFPVYGDELDIDGEVWRAGIVRNAKDPSQMYDFWMTAATEEIAMRPRTPYIGAEGQFEGYEDDWNSANVANIPYLEYKPVSLDGQLAPPPARQPMSDIPDGVLTMAMHANDNIKATTGLFDSSLGAMGNARSGAQERSQQRQGDVANFHFSDNLNRSVRHAGRCLIDMFPHYYDATRTIRIMGEDEKIKSVKINEPTQVPKVNPETGEPMTDMAGNAIMVEKILNDVTVGKYDLVVKAGPSYNTMREEAAEAMIDMQGKWPKLMDVAGDKVIRAMDWPGSAEMAERVKKTIDPRFTAGEDADEDQPMVQTPQGPLTLDQASQMLAEQAQQLDAMNKAISDYEAKIPQAQINAQTKERDAQSRERIAAINAQQRNDAETIRAQASIATAEAGNESREQVAHINAASAQDVAELNGLIKILIEKMQPPPGLEKQAMTKES